MFIATTLFVHEMCMKKINDAALVSGISRTKIIIMLLKECMRNIKPAECSFGQVRYQERSEACLWHTFHLQLGYDEYEYFLDLRKILKSSVSRILAIAVEKYLDKLLKRNMTDNYSFKNYIIAREDIDGIITWRLIWGCNQKILPIVVKSSA